MGLRSYIMVLAESRMNWKLAGASVAVATLLVVGVIALVGTAPSLSAVPAHETDEMLAAAPLFYHGSNGNGDTTAADMADIAKIGMLFKEMKGETDMYLENQTLIAYTKQMIKNKLLAKEIIKRFPDPVPKSEWPDIFAGSASGSGSGSR